MISLSGQLFPGAGAAARADREARAAARTPVEAIARAAFYLTRVAYQSTDFVVAATQCRSLRGRHRQARDPVFLRGDRGRNPIRADSPISSNDRSREQKRYDSGPLAELANQVDHPKGA